jgi:hypothetical protein
VKKIFLIVFFSAISIYSIGQKKENKWKLSAEVTLNPVPVYLMSGIDTSFKSTLSISPSLEIRSKKGFGLTYTPHMVTGTVDNGIYMHDITVGYEQYNRKTFNFSGDFSHYIFTGNSSVPASLITNEIYTVITYKNSWIKPMISFGMGFGWDSENETNNFLYDVTAATGISHSFLHEFKKSDFYFTPSVKINAGTNEYYSFMQSSKYISGSKDFNSYVSKKIGKKNDLSTKPELSISNLELAIRPSFEHGPFTISMGNSWYIPVKQTSAEITTFWYLKLNYEF